MKTSYITTKRIKQLVLIAFTNVNATKTQEEKIQEQQEIETLKKEIQEIKTYLKPKIKSNYFTLSLTN